MNNIKFNIILAFLFILVLVPFSYGAEDKTIKADSSRDIFVTKMDEGQIFLDKSILSLRQGNLPMAMTYINQALAASPKNHYVLFMKANMDSYFGDNESALKYYDLAIKYSEEKMFNYYIYRSICYCELGNYNNALKDLKTVEKILKEKLYQEDNSHIYLIMGVIEAINSGEDIELPIDKVVSKEGMIASLYSSNYKINNLSERGYRIIYKNLTNGIKTYPLNPALYTLRAICTLKSSSNTEKALADLDRALEINPFYLPAILEKSDYYLENGRYDESIEGYKFLLTATPNNYYILWRMGDAFLEKGEYNKSRDCFNRSLFFSGNISYNGDDIEMYMASIKRMVDVQNKENDYKPIIAKLNAIIRNYNNKH